MFRTAARRTALALLLLTPAPVSFASEAIEIRAIAHVQSLAISAYCLDTDGLVVKIDPCDPSRQTQLWGRRADGLLANIAYSGQCLASTEEGPVELRICDSATGDRWRFGASRTMRAGGMYGSRCLDVPHNAFQPGQPVIMWPCHTFPNQKWRFKRLDAEQKG